MRIPHRPRPAVFLPAPFGSDAPCPIVALGIAARFAALIRDGSPMQLCATEGIIPLDAAYLEFASGAVVRLDSEGYWSLIMDTEFAPKRGSPVNLVTLAS